MNTVLGIDVGGSTTKIIGYKNGDIFSPLMVKANDQKASVYGAFGKFIAENNMELSDIERVMITGVGASFVDGDLFGIKTIKVSEFSAIGKGGLFLSRLDNAIVVSMGTGTAFVSASKDGIYHMGGSGVGGGTLLGLSNRILNVRRFEDVVEIAKGGDLTNIDLKIRDITKEVVHSLPPETTASNFGKISDLASKNDLALGILNMVFQTIGVIAVFAARTENTKNIVLTGSLTIVPESVSIFEELEKLHDVKFIIPEHSEYATATGAAL